MSKYLNKEEEIGLNYPIFLSKEESMIKPRSLRENIEIDKGIICFRKNVYSNSLQIYKNGNRKGKKIPPILGWGKGKILEEERIAIYRGPPGAPHAARVMESMIASGAKKILLIGIAGSIFSQCKIGDIFIPTFGIREEGTSYHHLVAEIIPKPSESFLENIRRSLEDINYRTGGIWSIDAISRETKDKIKRYSKQEVLAVDMECTALMAVAMRLRMKFGAIFVITDEVFDDYRKVGFSDSKVKQAEKIICSRIKKIFSEK